jgi:predicted acyltransferase
MKSTIAPAQRLVSLDALRGFDMFWILGVEEVAVALGRASDAPWAKFFAYQLDHAAWAGFHFLDLIFPLFIFIAGVSMVFSLGKSLDEHGRAATVRKLVVRTAILYLLGIFCYDGIANGIVQIRWMGVLQRIAICCLFAGLAFVFLGLRARAILCAALLIGYWAVLSFVPVPGGVAGDFAEGPTHNIANWIDFHYLPGFKWDKTHDPEGLLSTLPAIATCLLGLFAGGYLKNSGDSPARKYVTLLSAGLVLALAGWAWHFQFPVIKKLWTSSYVLVAGGYSCLLLGAFHFLIEVKGWRRWATPFVWIGMNPITLYLSHHFIKYAVVAERIAGGPVADAFGVFREVWLALVVLALALVLAWFLHRRRIFLRV